MRKGYRVSIRAGGDLDDIADDTFETWRAPQMETLLLSLDERFALLAAHPGIGQMRSELGAGLRSFVVGPHVIYYRGEQGGIEIVAVLHVARDAAKALKGPI